MEIDGEFLSLLSRHFSRRKGAGCQDNTMLTINNFSKVGIMQPYFFPYVGYFAIMAHSNAWLVFDTAQYTKRTWINRNRVLHPVSGWQYLTVAIEKAPLETPIKDIKIRDPNQVCAALLGRLQHYKKAPFFQTTTKLIKETFLSLNSDLLVDLNILALRRVCEYLDISLNLARCSSYKIEIGSDPLPGEWAPAFLKSIGASGYLNPSGGIHLFNPSDFKKIGCKLYQIDSLDFIYDTQKFNFESKLSIIDALMWCEPTKINEAIGKAKICEVW